MKFASALAPAAFFAFTVAAQSTNSLALPPALPENMGVSLLRVLGALAVVIGIFLGGVWLFRNWQRLVLRRGNAARLNVLEVRSLGGRHALYVVGYEQERFLLASSPTGVNLLSHLAPTTEETAVAEPTTSSRPVATAQPVFQSSFAQALAQMLRGK